MITDIAAKDARIGDRIYNHHAYHESAAWLEITAIIIDTEGRIGLKIDVYTQWFHPEEGVAINRV